MERMKVEQFLAMLKAEGVKASRDTLYRYEKAGLLSGVERDAYGARLYTMEHVAQVREAREAVKSGMRQKCSEAQSERVAARKLGVVVTPVQVSGQAIKAAVRDLLAARPELADDDWGLYIQVYRALYGTDNMVRLRAMGAPTPETIGRRVREVLAERKEAAK